MKRIIAVVLRCTSVALAQETGSPSDAFYAAIRANDLSALRSLLAKGADANVPDARGGSTPLMHAAAVGSVESMKLLLDHKARVNAANTAGLTALMMSVTD